jgi:putative CocE/NonD family hydrolase
MRLPANLEKIEDMKTNATSILIEKNVLMETRDGIKLRSDIYRLDDGNRHPAILIRTPYNKTVVANGEANLFRTVQAGYAVIFQDIRGRYASEGTYDGGDLFLEVESQDGYDAIEWLASQPWCDANVGTAGNSYMARLQWMLAKENPPHLKAIAPWVSSSTPTSIGTYLYGVINLIMGASSAITMGLGIAESLEKQGKDVSEMRRMLARAADNPEEVYNYLPLKDIPHFDFPGLKEVWYARGLSAIPRIEDAERAVWAYAKVQVPCLQMSGWYEFNGCGTLINYQSMKQKGGSALSREGQYMVLGPWSHTQQTAFLGDVNFGGLADSRGSGLWEHTMAYYDKYLRGMDVSLPTVRYFLMGRNIWKEADDWPLPQTHWQRYYLHSGGRANSSAGNGQLTLNEPSAEPPDTFIYDPSFPVPTAGGAWSTGNGYVPGPLDQSRIEKREDILCYTTPELDEDLEVTGPLELHLFASTSARDTDFAAKLVDVYPDGRAFNAASGIIRARYRHSRFTPELVTPEEVIEYVVNLVATSQLFKKGHSIRIDVTSSSFPEYDRNMNTGNPIGEDITGITATQTVYHQSKLASYIDLPVIVS